MSRKRLLIIGPIAPPVGGVSVHIKRLAGLIGNDFEISFLDESKFAKDSVPNIRKMSFFSYIKIIRRSDLVHIHSGPTLLKLIHVFFSKILNKRTILTIHSNAKEAFISLFSLRLASKISDLALAVNKKIQETARYNATVLHAFIPPTQAELNVSAATEEWIKSKQEGGKFVFVSNAFRLERVGGVDLYGLDLLISVFSMKQISEKCALLFLIGSPNECVEYTTQCLEKIRELDPNSDFIFVAEDENFSGAAARADGTIRATIFDGDALSVRESLFLGKLTIASDSAVRPEGAIAFKSRDSNSLAEVIQTSINSRKPKATDKIDPNWYREKYLSIYLNH